MPVLTATGLWLFDDSFSLRMRAVWRWRHNGDMASSNHGTCVIRQKNGIATLYTLRTYKQRLPQAPAHEAPLACSAMGV